MCVLCKSKIKTATLWKVHINSKLHKLKLKETKDFSKNLNILSPNCRTQEKTDVANACNHGTVNLHKNETFNVETSEIILNAPKNINSKKDGNSAYATKNSLDLLPDMFFDNVDKKSKQNSDDDEWIKFQREINEESIASKKRLSGEQKNSAVDREIIEINEQMYQWSKVLDLERKLDKVNNGNKKSFKSDYFEEYLSDDNDFDENLDWRSKRFF